MLERDYQAKLIKKIEKRFKGCMVLKQDSSLRQGIPDLLVLWNDRWFALEVKASAKAPYQPNQEYYLEVLNNMAFSATIYPENEEAVLDAIQQASSTRRSSRISRREQVSLD